MLAAVVMRRHIGRAQVNVHITQCVHIHFPSGTRSHIVIPNKIFFDLHRFCLICDSATPGWQLHAIENSAEILQKDFQSDVNTLALRQKAKCQRIPAVLLHHNAWDAFASNI